MVQRINLFKLLVSVLLCQFAGVVGSIFTASSLENWYLLLEKPAFTLSSQVFFPVWVILYTLMGISFYLVWEKGLQEQKVKTGMLIFGIQLGLNVLTMLKFREISKMASYLLLPYIMWVSFAALLNYYLWILNS